MSLQNDSSTVRQKPQPAIMPTRVLDLGKKPLLDFGKKRFFNNRKESRFLKINLELLQEPLRLVALPATERDNYATLSHRWGDSTPFHTTTETISSYSNLILFWKLPKTFQHAVVIARSLGIRYLWIDALCIVQNDLQDWYNESRKMANVFKNALFNIAAHASKDDRSGFIYRGTRSGFSNRYPCWLSGIEGFEAAVEESPLSGRGWVFQERILSQRIIHFTKKGVFWEDAYGIQAENGSHSDCGGIRFMWRRYGIPHDWYRLMETYTSLKLTFEKDRLPAIAGLAAHFQQGAAVQSFAGETVQYYAGVWSNSICQGLLWHIRQEPGAALMRNPEANLPSWTWAAYMGAVRYPEDLYDLSPTATFQAFDTHSINPGSPRNKWPTKKALLSLKAYTKPMEELKWVCKREDEIPRSSKLFFRSGINWKLYHRKSFIGWVAMDEDQITRSHSKLWCTSVATKWPRYDANPLRSCRDCKVDGEHINYHTDSIDFMYHYVLVLSREDDDVFKRVGIGKIYESSWFPAKLPDFEEIEISIT